jgi:uncharacterized membrane protein
MTDNQPMARLRPHHAVAIVLAFGGFVVLADHFLQGGFARAEALRVAPGADGQVRIELADLAPSEVRFYRFLNTANQEVRFFVGRDRAGALQVAFDANEACAKLKRGYRYQRDERSGEDWLVCNKCDKAFRLEEVAAGGGGCKPIPMEHRVEGDQLVLAENDVLRGWRLFR